MGLDKWTSEKKLAKFIKQHIPDASNILLSKPSKKAFAFLTFPSEDDKNNFLTLLSDVDYKNKPIKLKPAGNNVPAQSRTLDEILKPAEPIVVESDQPLGTIEDKVTPLWQTPYSEQLLQKFNTVNSAFEGLWSKYKTICQKESNPIPSWIMNHPIVLPVLPSPEVNYYRNKVEFTIGTDQNGEIRVGFLNGQMISRTLRVEAPDNCMHIPAISIEIAKRLEKVIKLSNLSVSSLYDATGIWKSAVIRHSNRTNETMLNVYINPTPEEDIITTLLLQEFSDLTTLSLTYNTSEERYKVLHGPGFIREIILGKEFRVSPLSFFQINTAGCDALYTEAIKGLSGEVLLDICCGTGTIGICCSSNFQKVIGFEIIESAVNDAMANAERNNVSAEYYLGKAEDHIKEVSRKLEGQNIVGIVDPPRAGLHKSILSTIRTTKGLDTLVYVSCNPRSLCADLLDLCLPEAKRRRGPPFVPTLIEAVDMFPHTTHLECVVRLKRV
jgi:tRNA (uracil-5-)-methyltransferase